MREFISDENTTAEKLLRRCGVSRRLLIRLKNTENGITRNGKLLRSCDAVFVGDRIIINENGENEYDYNEIIRNSPLKIAYADNDFVVYEKPCNMPVHQSMGHYDDTLGNVFGNDFGDITFRPINRLDKDTTGLCICALSAYSAEYLKNSYNKIYYAIVQGKPNDYGIIDKPIDRESDSVIKRVVSESGKRAVTEYNVIKTNQKYSLLRVILHTGRTHQIRVHFSHIGYPLAGDDMYGGSICDIKRQALHCGEISITKPDGKKISLTSDIPSDMLELML